MNENPALEYRTRLEQRQTELADIGRRHRRLWDCLIICAFGLAAAAYFGFVKHSPVGLTCVAPSAAGVSLAFFWLRRNSARFGCVQRIADFYERGLARLEGTWQGKGIPGDEFQPAQHLYSADLDLFGRGSVFELLCTARSAVGRYTLAEWLLHPAGPEEISARQQAVAELRDRLELREYSASLAGTLESVEGTSLREWPGSDRVHAPRFARALALGTPFVVILLALLSVFGVLQGTQRWVIAAPLFVQAVVAACFHRRVSKVMDAIGKPSYGLALLALLLERFEAEHFEAPLLQRLQEGIRGSSRSVRQLNRLVWLLGLRRDEWCALAGSLLLWATNLVIRIDNWRGRHNEALLVWIDSLGQLEALLCLARYSYENPDYTFPTVQPDATPLLSAEGLGHPLLGRSSCVPCDLELDAQGTQLMIVTGSNMAGKSTLLRSAGVNSVLALAGAPVRASRMELSCFQVACSIRIQDSLLEGKSHFRAEVERLKSILDLAKAGPTLFLLDEVLSGTNSRDRFFGTEAVTRQLLEHGAMGLLTSHDLALTELANEFGNRTVNVHFEEYYEDGEMRFDYRMRPGVLTRTNGANIMAALGLLQSSAVNGVN